MIVKNAEPFFFPGSRTGCLLIHGFTGAPEEMLPLGKHLAGEGHTVLGVRLAGHGTRIEDLHRMVWQDWAASVQDGWHLLQQTADAIFLIGLSMGGVLALHQASNLPAAGVVSLSSPFRIEPGLRLTLLPILSRILPYISKDTPDTQEPAAAEEHFSYDRYPTRAILQLAGLLEAMRDGLPEVTIPALLMHSADDPRVKPENLDWIYQLLGTPDAEKEKILLENAGHVITQGPLQHQVFSAVSDFINKSLPRSG